MKNLKGKLEPGPSFGIGDDPCAHPPRVGTIRETIEKIFTDLVSSIIEFTTNHI